MEKGNFRTREFRSPRGYLEFALSDANRPGAPKKWRDILTSNRLYEDIYDKLRRKSPKDLPKFDYEELFDKYRITSQQRLLELLNDRNSNFSQEIDLKTWVALYEKIIEGNNPDFVNFMGVDLPIEYLGGEKDDEFCARVRFNDDLLAKFDNVEENLLKGPILSGRDITLEYWLYDPDRNLDALITAKNIFALKKAIAEKRQANN